MLFGKLQVYCILKKGILQQEKEGFISRLATIKYKKIIIVIEILFIILYKYKMISISIKIMINYRKTKRRRNLKKKIFKAGIII